MELCNIGKFFYYFALYESCCSYQLCRNIKKGIWIDINQWNMLWWLNDRSVKGLPDFPEFGGSLAQTVSFMLSAVCLFAWWCSTVQLTCHETFLPGNRQREKLIVLWFFPEFLGDSMYIFPGDQIFTCNSSAELYIIQMHRYTSLVVCHSVNPN